jgi:hypothetical protein
VNNWIVKIVVHVPRCESALNGVSQQNDEFHLGSVFENARRSFREVNIVSSSLKGNVAGLPHNWCTKGVAENDTQDHAVPH